jgi:hypothetical protein
MRTVLMINGPLPPEGKEFCPVCVALYKNQAEVLFRKDIETGLRDTGNPVPVTLDLTDVEIPDPQFAEVVAISIMPQLGLLRVCWGHVAPMQLTALPPALQGQMPGVPSLGGPR